MTQQRKGISTVRLSDALRSRLKVLAAARNQTMEAALAEAVEVWSRAGVGPQRGLVAVSGKSSEECKRMTQQVQVICSSKNERTVQATMVVLDGLSLLM